MEPLAPVPRELAANHGWDVSNLDFYVIHAGGPRILDDLAEFLDVDREMFRHSRRQDQEGRHEYRPTPERIMQLVSGY
jgi:predicted naringenin-chalcone synthase